MGKNVNLIRSIVAMKLIGWATDIAPNGRERLLYAEASLYILKGIRQIIEADDPRAFDNYPEAEIK